MFVVSLASIHVANVFYNGLLANISGEATVGRIGGIGVSAGHIGSTCAILLSLSFMNSNGGVFLFQITALIMIVLYSPLLLFSPPYSSSRGNIFFYEIV